jgi:hypothetical protein
MIAGGVSAFMIDLGAFRDGAGVPYSAFRPGFTTLMDRLNRFRYDQLLVSSSGSVPASPSPTSVAGRDTA